MLDRERCGQEARAGGPRGAYANWMSIPTMRSHVGRRGICCGERPISTDAANVAAVAVARASQRPHSSFSSRGDGSDGAWSDSPCPQAAVATPCPCTSTSCAWRSEPLNCASSAAVPSQTITADVRMTLYHWDAASFRQVRSVYFVINFFEDGPIPTGCPGLSLLEDDKESVKWYRKDAEPTPDLPLAI